MLPPSSRCARRHPCSSRRRLYLPSMVSAAPVQTRREVLDRLAGQRAALRALGLRRLGLSGSSSPDRPHPDSGVDRLVEFEAGATTLGNIMEVAELLEAVLGRRVEIVPADALSPYIGPKILADAEDIPLAPRLPPAHLRGGLTVERMLKEIPESDSPRR